MSAEVLFNQLRHSLQRYVTEELKVTIPPEALAIDNQTIIVFLRMKIKPLYNDKSRLEAEVRAAELLYPDISNKINTNEQRAKLYKFLDAMIELV